MPPFEKSSFEEIFEAIALCRERHLSDPCLILTYTALDALAWTVYGDAIPESKKRFLKLCEEYALPLSKLHCSALDLYSARCSMLHSLGWESSLSQSGLARSAHYSFGSDAQHVTQVALERIAPGKFVGINADDLISATIATHHKIIEVAQSDGALDERLKHAEGKQYMSLTRETAERVFTIFAAKHDRGEI
jgi:hypothetical protein